MALAAESKPAPGADAPAPGDRPLVVFDRCSKWYGDVLGISEVSLELRGGVIGLLGPNGAGKSTMIKLMAGLLSPSLGGVQVFGHPPAEAAEARRRIGYCPEHEGAYDELTAIEYVTALAELSGVPRDQAKDAAAGAIEAMGMTPAKDRTIKGFSKGMRQRTKLAQAIAHDPELILLDEPLTGVDPVARRNVIERIRSFGTAGKSIIISSHILQEIELITDEIVVIHRGQVLAEGNLYRIRELIDGHPHCIRVECARPRALAEGLASGDHIVRISFDDDVVEVETRNPDRCYDLIADLALDGDLGVRALTSPDNNLGAVFDYLTEGSQ